jgi:hypothetical protein
VKYSVLIAMTLGYSTGVLGGYLLSRRIVLRLSRGCSRPRLVVWVGALSGFGALLPGFFLSTVMGGTLGGGYGEVATQAVGIGSLGVPLGLGLGLAVVLAVVVAGGALAGAAVGRLIASILLHRMAI